MLKVWLLMKYKINWSSEALFSLMLSILQPKTKIRDTLQAMKYKSEALRAKLTDSVFVCL